MNHTPGPWLVDRAGEVRDINSDGQEWGAVANVTPNQLGKRMISEDEADANALLIAAAPDLLRACESVIRSMDGTFMSVVTGDVANDVRAAIAKAKGE